MNFGESSQPMYKKYPKYFNTAVFAMMLTGLWKSSTDRNINVKIFSLFLGLNILGILGSLASLYETEEYNVYNIFEILIYIPLLLAAIIGCVLLATSTRINQLFTIVEIGYSSFHDSTSKKATLTRNKADAQARFLIRCVSCFIGSAHFFKFISTNAWNPTSSTKIAFIPLSIYFYRSNTLLFYYIMYSLQFIVSAACATLNVICIMICTGLINIISAEIDALKFAFEDPKSLQTSGTSTMIINGNDGDNTEIEEERRLHNLLKSIVEQHNNLIRTKKELELLISPLAFIMFAMSELIVCFCTFQIYQLTLTEEHLDMPIIMNRVSLFIALMLQQFVYFVAGQRLETKSEELHIHLYNSTWYKNSTQFNSSLKIMFERTKVPFVLKAGYLIPINLRSFVTCMQATFSYFNLLTALSPA